MRKTEERLRQAVKKIVESVFGIKKREKVLVVGNPVFPSQLVARTFCREALAVGAEATLIFQKARTKEEPMEESVRAAIASNPDVVIAASQVSLGHDPLGRLKPYRSKEGRDFNNILYFLRAEKRLRAFWFPLPSLPRFIETVSVDYGKMGRLSRKIKEKFDRAEKVRIKTKHGTDLILFKDDRKARCNYDGDASKPGSGGNLPMGEVYVTPVAGRPHRGDIVIDVSLFVKGRTYTVREQPVYLRVEGGFVREIEGGQVADLVKRTIREAEEKPIGLTKCGKITVELAQVLFRNARGIGEAAVGVNPKAKIVGEMVEDEKAYGTGHIAIGAGHYDGDPAFIHLDAVVLEPEVSLIFPGGGEETILKNRKFKL